MSKIKKDWMTPQEAADYLGLHKNTLNRWRNQDMLPIETGQPRFFKVGRSVRYYQADLDAFLAAQAVNSIEERFSDAA